MFHILYTLPLLFSMCTAATNYSTANASFSWPGLTVTNQGVYTIYQPPALPYQVIEDVSPGVMACYFDYSDNTSTNVCHSV